VSFLKASSYSNQFYGSETNHHYKKDPSYYKRTFDNSHYKPLQRAATSYNNNDIEFQDDNDIAHHKVFSYDEQDEYGPSNWYKINQQCNGNFQSPIAIDIFNTSGVKFSPKLTLEGIDIVPSSIEVMNNGHSMKIKFDFPDNQQVRVSGGPLSNHYILDNAHWHWGKTDKSGSEHVLRARRFASEMHLVFFNSQYGEHESHLLLNILINLNFSGTLENAANAPKGLAVLGFFYDLDSKQSGHINPWGPLIQRVFNAKSSYMEFDNVFTVRDVIRSDEFHYFSYKGSLTTPNCTENVTWMLSSKPITITSSELKEFRQLRNEKGEQMFQNFRPLQYSTSHRKVVIYAH
jgi:carbonic anhydrase